MKRTLAVLMVSALSLGLLMSSVSYAQNRGKPGSGTSMHERGRPGHPPQFGHGRGPGPEGPHRDGFRGFGGPGMHGGFINHPEVQKKLGLSEEQIAKLKASATELEKRRIKNEADIGIARIEMEELLRAEKLDKAAIDKHVDALGDLQKQQVRGMVDHILAVHEILDTTQLGKVQGFMDRMRSHRGNAPFGRSWGREGGEEGRGRFREGNRGRPDGPPGDRGPGKGRRGRDNRPDGPPPRESQAPMHGPEGNPSDFGQAPNPFGPPPGGFPPPQPGGPEVQDDLADLGPALDFFLNSEE